MKMFIHVCKYICVCNVYKVDVFTRKYSNSSHIKENVCENAARFSHTFMHTCIHTYTRANASLRVVPRVCGDATVCATSAKGLVRIVRYESSRKLKIESRCFAITIFIDTGRKIFLKNRKSKHKLKFSEVWTSFVLVDCWKFF